MATLMIHVELFGKMFTAALYPDGIGAGRSRNRLAAKADTLEDLLARLRALWNEAGARHRAARIRSMALAIIRITAEQGTCTDAALRAGDFTAEEVARYGADAGEAADEIASNGPFSIVSIAGPNAA